MWQSVLHLHRVGRTISGEEWFFPFYMWSKIIEFLEQELCASRSHGSHPTCLHLPHSHHHGLRLAQVSSLEEELLGLYQALTSRAFLLRVGFGSGLTKKFGFPVRFGYWLYLAVLGCTGIRLHWAVLGCGGVGLMSLQMIHEAYIPVIM